MAAMYAALFICCLATAPLAMAGQQSATAAGTARKLLGSPSMGMMGMSTSPMMMSPMMMSPMMMAPAMSPMSKPMMYNLTLTPSMEVPATMNSASMGMCMLTFMMDSIKYSLNVSMLQAPTAAHIHMGAPGKNGPVVAFLYKPSMMPSNSTIVNGPLSMGTLMSSDFVGPAKGMSVMDFYNKYITTSMAYVNVHTVMYPDGIIRSNISPANMIKSA